MRSELLMMWLALYALAAPAAAQTSVSIGLPSVRIGIYLPRYPDLEPVPGYPVYYAPRLNSNYFFYDGLYWVYQGDNWYSSPWYNGPWDWVDPDVVPLYVLRIPVRYYLQPSANFLHWPASAPPRWDERWGNDWAQRHSGWDRWNRTESHSPAPLPLYQQKYGSDRYPGVERQRALQNQHYRYQPQAQPPRKEPAAAERGRKPGQDDGRKNRDKRDERGNDARR